MDAFAAIASIMNARDEASWCDAYYAYARRLGFDFTLFATLPFPTAPFSAALIRGTYPEAWRRHYDAKGYAAIDPTIAHCIQQNLPLVWSPAIFVTPEQRQLYRDAQHYGLRAGITLPAHGPGGSVGMLCLVSDAAPDAAFWQLAQDRLPEIMLLRDVLVHTSRQFISPGDGAVAQCLSPRELECLRWAGAGKTSKKIASLLHCSASTVNFHLLNARKKLGAPSRHAALTIAIKRGLLHI